MRITLTIEPDVAERIQQEVRRTGKGLKVVVNRALRLGFGAARKPSRSPRFRVKPRSLGIKPGIDPDRMNQLIDELEAAEAARKLAR